MRSTCCALGFGMNGDGFRMCSRPEKFCLMLSHKTSSKTKQTMNGDGLRPGHHTLNNMQASFCSAVSYVKSQNEQLVYTA